MRAFHLRTPYGPALPLVITFARHDGDDYMLKTIRVLAAATFMVACSGLAPVVHAQKAAPDFGDDESRWAKDGECDDRRFSGAGMTDTPFLASDIGHDASDCRAAWSRGDIRLAASSDSGKRFTPNFGGDEGEWAEDGECDDPRFRGVGMTDTTLLEEDVMHDAADCQAAWESGDLKLIGVSAGGTPDFGDDEGDAAEDDACDDLRFAGGGMSATALFPENIMHDASDCEAAWDDGDIELH